MKETDKFSLIKHSGPYESWPSRTKLVVDGVVSSAAVAGYTLLRQFELPENYLLITDYDCLFEEAVTVTLLDRKLRTCSHRTIGVPYGSFWFQDIEWLDKTNFVISMKGDADLWKFTIREWGIPYIAPRLQMKRIRNTKVT